MQTEDILMCPGPNEISDRVLRAMMQPAICPVFDEFQEFYERTLDMLAQVFQTTNQVIPIPGSGRSGVESAITSVVEPGERSLTIVAGQFGSLAVRVVDGIGGKGEGFNSPWGEPIDLEAFEQKLSSGTYKLVTMVHNETSTVADVDGYLFQSGTLSNDPILGIDIICLLNTASPRTNGQSICHTPIGSNPNGSSIKSK